MTDLSSLRVAVLATDGFEEVELTEPVRALKEAGARVEILSTKSGQIQAFRHHDKGTTVSVDRVLNEAQQARIRCGVVARWRTQCRHVENGTESAILPTANAASW